MAEDEPTTRRFWTYTPAEWDPSWYHKIGVPFFGYDEWGRHVITIGVDWIGYVSWAWRTCWCQDCHEVREQTYRALGGP